MNKVTKVQEARKAIMCLRLEVDESIVNDILKKVDAAFETLNINKALTSAITAIYFDDSSDYSAALWSVVRALNPEAAELLEEDGGAAYNKYCV